MVTTVTTKAMAKVAAVATGLAMATSMLSLAPMAHAAALTSAQVQSILSLLTSFGADSATIANVQASLTGGTPTGTTGGSTSSSCAFTKDLTLKSTGADVTCLQKALIAAGYSVPAGATGYFGTQTLSAVIAWQKAAGISPAAGYFGPKSRAAFGGSASGGSTGGVVVGTGTPAISGSKTRVTTPTTATGSSGSTGGVVGGTGTPAISGSKTRVTTPTTATGSNGISTNTPTTNAPSSNAATITTLPTATAVPVSGATAQTDLLTADFKARCTGPGVLVCEGFDDVQDFARASGGGYASGLYPTGSDNSLQGIRDMNTKISGGSSLKFNIRPGSTVSFSTNPAGYWFQQFGKDGAAYSFGENTTLYLQFRTRVDSNMLDFNWSKVSSQGWKTFIVFGPIPGTSCTGDQFVQENSYQRNILSGYTSCGSPGLVTNNGKTPYLFQQGDYHCAYGTNYATDPGCFRYKANTWINEYWIVRVGTYGVANSSFTAYAAYDGQPLKKVIDLPQFNFGSPSNHQVGMMAMILQPYFSGAIATTSTPAAAMWFDELIVSKQPIAAPLINTAPVTLPAPTLSSTSISQATATAPTTSTPSSLSVSTATSLPSSPSVSTTASSTLSNPSTGTNGLGWHELPNTRIADICPHNPTPPGNCAAVVGAWSGGVADTNRNRLLMTGGGHNDYGGNEWYALDLSSQKMQRIIEPSPTVAYGQEANPDGRPAARHTYGGLAFVPTRDRVIMHGGALYSSGTTGTASPLGNWLLDLRSSNWTRLDPTRGTPPPRGCCAYQSFMAYDSNTDAVYMHDYNGGLFRYDDLSNLWSKIAPGLYGSDVPGTAVIDAARRTFYFIGGGRMYKADISSGTSTQLARVTPGAACSGLITRNAPGVAYDSTTKLIVGWAGGDAVYEYNPDTNDCTVTTIPGGPGAATPNGMFGRFQYFPKLNVFAVVTSTAANAFILRLHSSSVGAAPSSSRLNSMATVWTATPSTLSSLVEALGSMWSSLLSSLLDVVRGLFLRH